MTKKMWGIEGIRNPWCDMTAWQLWWMLYPRMCSSRRHWGPPLLQGPSACNQRSDRSTHEGVLIHTPTPNGKNTAIPLAIPKTCIIHRHDPLQAHTWMCLCIQTTLKCHIFQYMNAPPNICKFGWCLVMRIAKCRQYNLYLQITWCFKGKALFCHYVSQSPDAILLSGHPALMVRLVWGCNHGYRLLQINLARMISKEQSYTTAVKLKLHLTRALRCL